MPNKDLRLQTPETKASANSPQQHGPAAKTVNAIPKASMSKVAAKELAMSPGAPPAQPAAEDGRPELLGSLTTLQQQRTSARVIKKLKLEPPVDKRDTAECETQSKTEEKESTLVNPAFPTVKQRMPKALWSADEKSVFFEALNEYGKDFDAITAYICAKMKKKGMPDGNLKTKTQVSHFYYRTWHKLAKHVHFDENVKKVAQELYALINYGELRRKLVSVNEKTCARLGEMVRCGSMAVRARGRTLRVRTPMCRALRRLNQIAERACGARVCSRAQVVLRARNAAAWARVQAAAHNPRACVALPLRTPLAALLRALRMRWGRTFKKSTSLENGLESKRETDEASRDEEGPRPADQLDDDEENHLGLAPDRCTLADTHLPKKLALHVGPRAGASIHLPVLSPSEPLSSHKICFSSYLERMGSKLAKDGCGVKMRTPKRQRKDSATDKEKESEAKKLKPDESEHRPLDIDETAIDGIELMASYKSAVEDDEKPSTEDEKELKCEETAEEEGEPDRDKDSFSEMEDDEKYNKSDTDNESDGRHDKGGKERNFNNLKVKFRIRPKKRGGSVYTLVTDKEEEAKAEEGKAEGQKVEGEKAEGEAKPDIDVDTALRQIRRGWSAGDAGELTVGDLYLMFGARSKLELDYWWAEPTPPLPQPAQRARPPEPSAERADSAAEEDAGRLSPRAAFSHDSNDGASGDERRNEQLSSPDHKASGGLRLVSKLINRPAAPPPPPAAGFAQLSDRLKRLLALAGNALVSAPPPARCACGHTCAATRAHAAPAPPHHAKKQLQPPAPVFRHPTPIAPRPDTEATRSMNLDDLPRWRRGRPRVSEVAERARARDRRVVVQRLLPLLPKLPPPNNLIPVKIVSNSPPAPPRILPKPAPTSTSDLSFFYVLSESNGQFYFHDGDRRIPIAPLPDATDATDQDELREEEEDGNESEDIKDVKMDFSATEVMQRPAPAAPPAPPAPSAPAASTPKLEHQGDITSFLPAESLSLSPSRLLRDAEGWLDGAAHDFSLSSFLHTLEARAPDHAVESHLQSLMAESSVDYVAKFADLAAEVTEESDPLAEDLP